MVNDWNFVTELNYKAAFHEQDGKCLTCNKQLDINSSDNFVWIDKTHKDIYCKQCGLNILKKQKDESNENP